MATEDQIKNAHEGVARIIDTMIDAGAMAVAARLDELRGTADARRGALHDQLASIARAAVLDHVLRTAVAELRAAVQQGNLPRIVDAIDALERDGRRLTCDHDWQQAGQFDRCVRCGGERARGSDDDDD